MAEQTKKERSWWEEGVGRRTFLKGAAGTMALLVVQSAFDLDALAQQNPATVGFQYFSPVDALTVEAIAERLWPTTENSPGARDAGVIYYIDNALAGQYSQYQLTYRTGLDALEGVSQEQHDTPFRSLSIEQQDALLEGIAGGEVLQQPREGLEGEPPVSFDIQQEVLDALRLQEDLTGGQGTLIAGLNAPRQHSLQTFFNLIRTHTMEGLFADPIYGGNRNFAGWRAVGYPGPYYLYTAEEQQQFVPLDKPFQSLADI